MVRNSTSAFQSTRQVGFVGVITLFTENRNSLFFLVCFFSFNHDPLQSRKRKQTWIHFTSSPSVCHEHLYVLVVEFFHYKKAVVVYQAHTLLDDSVTLHEHARGPRSQKIRRLLPRLGQRPLFTRNRDLFQSQRNR